LGRSEHIDKINSDFSRSESYNKPPNSSFQIGGVRNFGSSSKRYARNCEYEEKDGFMSKGNPVSKSMSRMMRPSPKIHLKQHIHNNNLSHSTQKRSFGLSNGFKNKLHLNRYAVETGMPTESSRNQKLESLLQKHVLKPVRTTNSGSRSGGKLFPIIK